MVSNHDTCMPESIPRSLGRGKNFHSLGHLSILLSEKSLFEHIEFIAVLKVFGVIEDLNLLDFFHEVVDPFTHFIFGFFPH